MKENDPFNQNFLCISIFLFFCNNLFSFQGYKQKYSQLRYFGLEVEYLFLELEFQIQSWPGQKLWRYPCIGDGCIRWFRLQAWSPLM